MITLLGMYLFVLAAVIVVMMLRDHQMGRCDLLSVRNIVLLGFIIFQVTSGGIAMISGEYGRKPPLYPLATGLEFTAMTTVFAILFFIAYNRGWLVQGLASRLPPITAVPNNYGMLVIAAVITVVAIVMRFGVGNQLVFKVTEIVGTGLSAIACGIVAWAWGRRFANPAMIVYALLIVLANISIVLTQAFGRRGLVAVGAALIWGWYYSSVREQRMGRLIAKLALLSIGPFLLVAMFTAVRSGQQRDRTAWEYFELMASGAPIVEGVQKLLQGQDTAPISMWLLEAHPDEFAYRHLFTIRWFFMYPVPRDWWESKPETLATMWPDMANVYGVASNFNVGPGIVGHAGAEGGWYALFLYAIVSGLFVRFFDEAVQRNLWSPLMVLTVGSALGEMLALTRGETGSFAAKAVITIAGCYILFLLTNRFLISAGLADPEEALEGAATDEGGEAWPAEGAAALYRAGGAGLEP